MNRESSAPVGDAEWLRQQMRPNPNPRELTIHTGSALLALGRIANTLNRRGDVESALHLALVETVCELRACLAGENDLGDTPAVIEKAEAAIAAMHDDGRAG